MRRWFNMNFVIPLLLKVISSDVTKTLIGMAINKLLAHSSDGITKDLAETMIDGIAKSKANPTTNDVFKDALLTLKQG